MRRRNAMLAGVALLAAPEIAGAAFPDRPITLVTGYAPGGSTDIAARLLADRLAPRLGPDVRIVVENRPGASGRIATEWLTRQPPDGYTIMVTETGAAIAAPAAMVGGTRYDPIADFTQLGLVSVPPEILVVTPGFPGGTAAEVLERMRAAPPDSLTYATSGVGGVLHFRAEMLAQALGTRFVHVPYRSGAQMMQAILSGEAQFGIAALASATAMVRDGAVRGVAIGGARRFPLFPDVPTFAELGIDMPGGGGFLLIAPAGLPPAVVTTLNGAMVAALAEPALRDRMLLAGHAPPEGPNTPEGARDYVVQELAAFRVLAERTGIRLQP